MSESKGKFKVKFRGIRGSYPTPDAKKLQYGGNTACVEINVNGHLIIIDAGSGLINLGDDLMQNHISSGTDIFSRKSINAIMLISHAHQDHIQGIPFFKPAYLHTTRLNVFTYGSSDKNFEETLTNLIFNRYFPLDLGDMAANISIDNFKENMVVVLHPNSPVPEIKIIHSEEDLHPQGDDVIIRCMRSSAHPKDGVLVFRIEYKNKSLVYATDKESYIGNDRALINFARNADVLIHDAQYTMEDYTNMVSPKQGFGHSTPEMAIDIAKASNVKQLILFHIDPAYSDDFIYSLESQYKTQFDDIFYAKENQELDLI